MNPRRAGLALCLALTACQNAKEQKPAVKPLLEAQQRAHKAATVPKAKQATAAAAPATPPSDFRGARVASIWNSVAEVNAACEAHLTAAKALEQSLIGAQGARTALNTLEPMNQLLMELDQILPQAELIANVHPEKPVRTAAEKCEQTAKKYLSQLKLNRKVFDALSSVPIPTKDPRAKRFVELLLRDYRRAGVDRDAKTRTRLAALDQKIVRLGQRFARQIREDKRYIEVSEKELAGLPADYIAARKKSAKNGKIRISTEYPDFYPFETYADNEGLRKALYTQYLARAYPKNEAVLRELLATRHAYATSLGFSDWAEYNAEDKMVKKKSVIAAFLARVVKLTKPALDRDLKEVLVRKQRDIPGAKEVAVWDRFYYVNKIRAERFGLDPAAIRAHFAFKNVKAGVLALAQELFALRFERRKDAKVWHPSVEVYDVYDRGMRIAQFYLDLHPREGKYGHAAEFPILAGVPGKQLPAAALVTNFPDPSKGPALTEHHQVSTFFHEFGHLMHQLLAGRHHWVTQSGISCEWDFVEAPSQLLEEWTFDHGVLSRFAKHYQTGKPISKELATKLRRSNEFGKGMHVMRQMFYAHLSLALHASDPKGLALMDRLKSLYKVASPYPYVPGTAVFANFGHLNGYSSMYYTYMWSLVLAKDLLTRFQRHGLMDRATALAYREAVLEPGGSVEAAKMVETFLGRPYSFNAFERWLAAR